MRILRVYYTIWARAILTFTGAPGINPGPMPKMKTNKSVKKRFRVSGSGRVRRSKAGGNHLMQEKSRKRIRRARNNDMVDKTLERKIKRLIPYG
jgi:large subunit ribosomal protein L35